MMNKTIKTILISSLCLLLLLSLFACKEEKEPTPVVLSDQFDLTSQVLDFIEDTYYGDIDYDYADEYMAYALVSSLGQYNYINSVTDLLSSSTDKKGFGLLVKNTLYNERLIDFILPGSPFLTPYEGKTAQRGDEIYAIAGQRVSGLDYSTYVTYLSTLPSDVPVTFTLKRGEETFDVAYVKTDFHFPNCIYVDNLPGIPEKYGYIYLRTFDDNSTQEEFLQAVRDFNADGNEALILDLRGNGGGSSTVLSTVAAALIGDEYKAGDPLIEIHYARQNIRKSITANASVTERVRTPIYVLCNGGTASASEALIGAMKAYGTLSALIGQETVGKGVAQNGVNLYDGAMGYFVDKGTDADGKETDIDAYLVQVIVGQYYIIDPSVEGGRYCMHGKPFLPDVEVTGENVISTDYSQDSYIRAVLDYAADIQKQS